MKVANTKLEADMANMFFVVDVAKAVSPYYTYPLTSWYGVVTDNNVSVTHQCLVLDRLE